MKKCFEKLLEILRQNLRGTEIERWNENTENWSRGFKKGKEEMIAIVQEYAEQQDE